MALAKDYASVMGRSNDIQKDALGLDYAEFETSPIAFDNSYRILHDINPDTIEDNHDQ